MCVSRLSDHRPFGRGSGRRAAESARGALEPWSPHMHTPTPNSACTKATAASTRICGSHSSSAARAAITAPARKKRKASENQRVPCDEEAARSKVAIGP